MKRCTTTQMIKTLYTCGLLSALVLAGSAYADLVVLSDTFTGGAGNLGGQGVETPQTAGDTWWTQATVVKTGTEMEISTSGTFGKAAAPFNDALLGGAVRFTYSVDWRIDNAAWTDTSANFYT